MQIDVGLIFAAIAGAGTVLATIAAAEKYISSKFKGAVVGILRNLEYDRKLRHLEADLQTLRTALAKLQDADVSLEVRIYSRCKDLDKKINRAYGVLNAQKIAHARLESAARVLGSRIQGDGSISAILMDTEAK